MEKDIKTIVSMGEGVNTEFKTAKSELPKKSFESVCAFLNTSGGYIILGVDDNKNIVGVNEEFVDKIKKDYTTMCNNKNVIDPTIISELKEIKIDGKIVLYTYIQEAREIHKTKGKVFIRNYEGDFDITNNFSIINNIYNQKGRIFTEDIVYPKISVQEDLRTDLIDRARKLANSNVNKRHPWMDLNDVELLKSAGLYKVDKDKKTEGVTLAGVMLFGKDEVIASVNPYCRTDALYRKDDLERYDDRDFVETNLLDMYDRLIEFVTKYTMDRFALDENMRRVSPRSTITREMIINMIMHRDLLDGHTSRIIIYKDKIICENPNSFGTMSEISIKNYTPLAKNPTLAKFFRQIGYADELGSGVRRITKNSLLYTGKMPIFEDSRIFRVTIPLLRDKEFEEVELINLANDVLRDAKNNYTCDKILSDTSRKVLESIKRKNDITQKEILEKTNYSIRTIKRSIEFLKENKYIERVGNNRTGYWKVIRDK